MTKVKCEPNGGPKSRKTGPVAESQQKKKNPMQPFACLILDTKKHPKTPFEGRHKQAKYGSMRQQVGGIYRNDSSDDERKESDSLDGSSGAEVKRDDNYTIGD